MRRQQYFTLESHEPISPEVLKGEDKETQIEVMKQWFFRSYENPAENTPFESKEGGYIYIWGGPYNAKEELTEEFYGIIPEDVINELAEELEMECSEWSGIPTEDRYDKYYYDVMSANTASYGTLTEALTNIRMLAETDLSENLNNFLNMMLYVNVITALETFLSDAFISTVLNNDQLIRKFVKSNTDFSERKIALNDIFETIDNINIEVRKYLLDLIWHNLAKVKNLYKYTLEIDFPGNMEKLYRAVAIRHDIVHRSGKTKAGKTIEITKENLIELLDEVKSFADQIDMAWGV